MDLTTAWKMHKNILGMNARNLSYVRPHNKKQARKIADNKIASKHLLEKHNIPVPDLIAKIASKQELDEFDWDSLPPSFALKPSQGFGGEGIVVVYGRKKGRDDAWVKADGSLVTVSDMKTHIQNILDGSFSITHSPDIGFFEERLKLTKVFKPYSYKGIPDIRVIVFNKVPVMAMLRLPTKESDGKGNVQHGAIGAGIDLATGTTTTAVMGRSRALEYVPGTRLLISGIKIPYWNDILSLAVKCQDVSGIGFLGADVAIDRDRGPVLLELNVRPGLSIQIANLAGLKDRLERVAGLKIKSIDQGVRVGKDLFGGEIEEELEGISGKRVVGSIEKITLTGKNEEKIDVEAKIDTGALMTSIDIELAKQLGFKETLEAFSTIEIPHDEITKENRTNYEKSLLEKYKNNVPHLERIAIVYSASGMTVRPVIKLTFTMDKKTVIANVNIIDRKNLTYPMIVGKNNLKQFLVDVSK